MRTIIFLFATSFLFTSCDKAEKNGFEQEYPSQYYLYFDLQKEDGATFENGEVEISNPLIMLDGKLITDNIFWTKMGIVQSIEGPNGSLFGEACDAPGCYEDYSAFIFSYWAEEIFESQEGWVTDTYYLLKYRGAVLDTLRIKDSTVVETRFRKFDFYLNEQPVEVRGNGDFDQINPTYITIQQR